MRLLKNCKGYQLKSRFYGNFFSILRYSPHKTEFVNFGPVSRARYVRKNNNAWKICNYTIIFRLAAHILLLCFVCKFYCMINLNILDQSTFDILLNRIFNIDLRNLIALYLNIMSYHQTKK